MRATLAALLMSLTACGGSALAPEEPDTSASSIALASTTSVAAATTSEPEEECEGADRGFLCPPDLPELPRGSNLDAPQALLAPGKYRTRIFRPALEFTQDESFRSPGEGAFLVILDISPSTGVSVWNTGSFSDDFSLEGIAEHRCAKNASTQEDSLFGFPSVVLNVTAGDCILALPGLPVMAFFVPPETRARFYLVDFGAQDPLLAWVQGPARGFDRFLEETAQPLLDTVRFLDE